MAGLHFGKKRGVRACVDEQGRDYPPLGISGHRAVCMPHFNLSFGTNPYGGSGQKQ